MSDNTPLASLVDPQHTAVIVVDMQLHFTGNTLFPPVEEVLPRLRHFVDTARAAAVPLIFLRITIPKEQLSEVWQQQYSPRLLDQLAPDSPGVAFHPQFEPQPGDLTIIKHRFSGFVGTDLEALLRTRGIRTVVVAGLTTDVCVGCTARDAFQRDFHTVTLADCTAERTQARHEASLQSLGQTFGLVCTSDDVMTAWRTQPVASGV